MAAPAAPLITKAAAPVAGGIMSQSTAPALGDVYAKQAGGSIVPTASSGSGGTSPLSYLAKQAMGGVAGKVPQIAVNAALYGLGKGIHRLTAAGKADALQRKRDQAKARQHGTSEKARAAAAIESDKALQGVAAEKRAMVDEMIRSQRAAGGFQSGIIEGAVGAATDVSDEAAALHAAGQAAAEQADATEVADAQQRNAERSAQLQSDIMGIMGVGQEMTPQQQAIAQQTVPGYTADPRREAYDELRRLSAAMEARERATT
jgi:hypothetical protein